MSYNEYTRKQRQKEEDLTKVCRSQQLGRCVIFPWIWQFLLSPDSNLLFLSTSLASQFSSNRIDRIIRMSTTPKPRIGSCTGGSISPRGMVSYCFSFFFPMIIDHRDAPSPFLYRWADNPSLTDGNCYRRLLIDAFSHPSLWTWLVTPSAEELVHSQQHLIIHSMIFILHIPHEIELVCWITPFNLKVQSIHISDERKHARVTLIKLHGSLKKRSLSWKPGQEYNPGSDGFGIESNNYNSSFRARAREREISWWVGLGKGRVGEGLGFKQSVRVG